MMFTDTVTLYNRRADPATRAEAWDRHELRGALWQSVGAVTDRRNPRAGSHLLYLPANVPCAGGETFVPPDDYESAPHGHWTLREGDLVQREGRAPAVIVSVAEHRYGSPALHHWEVCAR